MLQHLAMLIVRYYTLNRVSVSTKVVVPFQDDIVEFLHWEVEVLPIEIRQPVLRVARWTATNTTACSWDAHSTSCKNLIVTRDI